MKTSVFLILFLISSCSAYASQAIVRSYADTAQPVGQAFLTHSGDQCLALLPTHVVKESVTPVFLHEGDSLLGESFKTVDLGDDLSLVEVRGNISKNCGYSMSTISRAVGNLIKGEGLATLRSINGDGSIARLTVAIIDDDGSIFLRVRPTNDKAQIRKGHSGSLLMINDQPVGMLLSVNAKHGVGKVLRMDKLLSKAEKYWLSTRALRQSKKDAQSDSRQVGKPSIVNNGDIISWSVLPVDAKHRATNLTATNDALPWRAKVDRWPVEIELDLTGEKLAISALELDGKGVLDEELPLQIEIFINVSKGKKRWRSLFSRKLLFDENDISRISFVPTWARQIKLVIRSNQGARIVGLRRLHYH